MAKEKKPFGGIFDFKGGAINFVKDLFVPESHKGDDDHAKADSDKDKPKDGGGGAPKKPGKVSGWRPAESLITLRDAVDRLAPHRSKASDGIVGDTNHKNKKSDHNPWVIDDGVGVVTAIDITHDPERGCDAAAIAEAIVNSQDGRVKYVIWNRRISNFLPKDGEKAWAWRKYKGGNPHDKHVHVSVREDKALYDNTDEWNLGAKVPKKAPEDPGPVATPHDTAGAIAWGKKVPAPFKKKAIEIANRLQMDPSVLMAVMAFETGRRFKSSTLNVASNATGLIQFMPKTAISLGTTIKALAAMTEVEQLDYVEKYLNPYAGKMKDLASAYMAVLWPKGVPEPLSFVLFEAPSKAYNLNKGLDTDDDGKVTKAEASDKVQKQLVEGMRPENFG